MCLERPFEATLGEKPLSMTDLSQQKAYDFDFKYGQKPYDALDFAFDLKVMDRSMQTRKKRKHHRRKQKGFGRKKFPSVLFCPSLENIDEDKEVVIDPLRAKMHFDNRNLASLHKERALGGTVIEDGRKFRHRYYKREKATT
ncbi:predicted protein [Nematostella vectensis]|uniref:Uncharacterized protein n=1 Tax=Nematostella vectensis TaxID=45351 RepID=A7RHC7_NEMVE|nr:uncharacterized protein LOC5521605 [Nematostella vectensis]EDO49206.1 predicted protein [Nematostella vectensis]|eukprot:XP_001641269.1 predicted protein [Nematostella vectensis]